MENFQSKLKIAYGTRTLLELTGQVPIPEKILLKKGNTFGDNWRAAIGHNNQIADLENAFNLMF